MSKGEGELKRGESEQVAEFAHQVGFGQILGCNGEGALTACGLPKGAALGSIEAQFEHVVAKGSCPDSSHIPQGQAARWLARAETSDSSPGTQRPDQGRASPLPILADSSDPSAPPLDRPLLDRPLTERCPARPNWEYAD
jgi:hypothetical protein